MPCRHKGLDQSINGWCYLSQIWEGLRLLIKWYTPSRSSSSKPVRSCMLIEWRGIISNTGFSFFTTAKVLMHLHSQHIKYQWRLVPVASYRSFIFPPWRHSFFSAVC
jgi:hypothetical protein